LRSAVEKARRRFSTGRLSGNRPIVGKQKSGFVRRKVDHVADTSAGEHDTVDAFGEFLRPTEFHHTSPIAAPRLFLWPQLLRLTAVSARHGVYAIVLPSNS
jgi:hypothetical protein